MLSKLQLESMFQLTCTIYCKIRDRSKDQRKEIRLRRRWESERRHISEETAEQSIVANRPVLAGIVPIFDFLSRPCPDGAVRAVCVGVVLSWRVICTFACTV